MKSGGRCYIDIGWQGKILCPVPRQSMPLMPAIRTLSSAGEIATRW
jgi:hypothetical protein